VNSCVIKDLFFEGVGHPKNSPKKSGNAFSNALLMSHYQNFSAGDAEKQTARVFKKMVDHKFLSMSNADST